MTGYQKYVGFRTSPRLYMLYVHLDVAIPTTESSEPLGDSAGLLTLLYQATTTRKVMTRSPFSLDFLANCVVDE